MMEVDDGSVVRDRTDGREPMEFRPTRSDFGIACVGSGRVEGSVRLAAGKTAVTAEVLGPSQASSAAGAMRAGHRDDVRVSVKTVVRPVSGMPGEREQELEQTVSKFVEGVLDPSCPPFTTVTVVVQILSEDGSLLSCILNATAAALIEAGIPLFGYPVSVTIGMPYASETAVQVDPNLKEERASEFLGTYTYVFTSDKSQPDSTKPRIVQMSTIGRSTTKSVVIALAAAERAALVVLEAKRETVSHDAA